VSRPRRALAVLALAASFGFLAPAPASAVFTNGKLQVIHMDAGQGDGAVIITPGGQVVLIDEGTNFTAGTSPPSCARVLSTLQSLGVTHVDMHFASHYHADHIGCITSLTGITIDYGWDRAESYSSGTYTNYAAYLGAKRRTLTKGQIFTLDSLSAHPVTIKVVALNGDGISTTDENSQSLVLKLSYGEYDEEFGGDLPGYPSGTSSSNTNIETKVGPQVGKVEVYKVHHHGSAYASYDDWLNATQPKVGIVSCGTGNGYGHPTSSALGRLHAHGVRTYWTETGSGVAPNPLWDKVANSAISIYAVWQPGGVDSIYGTGIADTLTNSGTATDMIAPLVSVTSPNGGETIAAGSAANITWSASDNVAVTTVDVDYSLDGGANWINVGTGLANSGAVGWSVPNSPSVQVLARVTAHDGAGNTGADVSNAQFTIADQTLPAVVVTAPNGGESYGADGTQNVTWTSSDNVGVDSVNVDYSLHGPFGPWAAIQHGIANSGTVSWTLPHESSDSVLVRVTSFDHALNQNSDLSDDLFQITPNPLGVGPGSAVVRLALHPAVPSPSHGSVQLRYALPESGPTRLEVLDVIGRTLWVDEQSWTVAGEHQLMWPGVDQHGSRVGSGIYFARLTVGAERRVIKLVLLQ
jgi:beta-lactamase superfamily II metal-dependent hydrolase